LHPSLLINIRPKLLLGKRKDCLSSFDVGPKNQLRRLLWHITELFPPLRVLQDRRILKRARRLGAKGI